MKTPLSIIVILITTLIFSGGVFAEPSSKQVNLTYNLIEEWRIDEAEVSVQDLSKSGLSGPYKRNRRKNSSPVGIQFDSIPAGASGAK